MDHPDYQFDPCPGSAGHHESPEQAPAARPQVLLLADDLTGACDAGICFVHHGVTATVQLNGRLDCGAEPSDLQALVAGTRNLQSVQAQQQIDLLLGGVNLRGINIFHKVDSAGRGNPGAELETLWGLMGCDAVVFAPAFPAAGRKVSKGQLQVTDFSGQMRVVELSNLFSAACSSQIALIPTGKPTEVQMALAGAHSAGRNYWICDAETEQDLELLVEAAVGLRLRLLWSGSAGLAAAVARHMAGRTSLAAALLPVAKRRGRVLVLSGTDHPVTETQIDRLAETALELNMDAETMPAFDCGWARIDWSRMTAEEMRRFWQRIHEADQRPVAALVLTGGDTAAFVLEALGVVSLQLGGELEQGIPWSLVRCRPDAACQVEELMVITKSGGFGTHESLARCVELSQRMMG